MRSGSSIELDKGWWRKEAPELKKSGAAFEKALDEFAKANSALKPGADGAAKALLKAIEGLEVAGRQVGAEARELAKKADKKLKADYDNTAEVMGKPLERALAAARTRAEGMAAPEAEADDEDAGEGIFADPDQYRGYLKRVLPKLKKGAYAFAFGVPSTKPEEARFAFHRSKGGRQLGGMLKKAVGAKKFAFGVAGAEVAEEAGVADEVSARTLVLALEGGKIPGLARRAKVLLKLMGSSAFNKVKVLVDGKEVESADDTTPDTLEPVDLDAPDAPDEIAAAEPAPQPPEAPAPPLGPDPEAERIAALRRRLGAAQKAIQALPVESRASFTEVARTALQRIAAHELDAAEKLIGGLESRLAAPPGAQPAPKAPPPPPPVNADRIRKVLGDLVRRITALPDAELARTLGAQAGQINTMLRAGQLKDAAAAVPALATALAEATAAPASAETPRPKGSAVRLAQALLVWNETRSHVARQVAALQAEITTQAAEESDFDEIRANLGNLDEVLEELDDSLSAKLGELRGTTDEALKAQLSEEARAIVRQFQAYVGGNGLISDIDDNGFIALDIKPRVTAALAAVLETI